MKFSVYLSLLTDLREDVREGAELISYVFRENVSKL
jgi:hypothetical protein